MHWDFVTDLCLILGLLVPVVLICRPNMPVARAAVCGCVFATESIYVMWRIGHISNYTHDLTLENFWTWLFVLAEFLCIFECLLFFTLMSKTRDNTIQADLHEAKLRSTAADQFPAVDVWIATYNEEWAILEKTIVGALAIDYPANKLNVYVLDDGRRDWLRHRCLELGVHHVTRPDNKGKKAGNHNNALCVTTAPLILSLDADFVPFREILYRLVGFFEDKTVGIIQTPQTYYNSDIIRRSLQLSLAVAPDELDLFYHEIQPARDAWDAAFYCGSCAVLRRAAIEIIGGFVTETDVEDQATAVKLLANGFKTRFLNESLSVGLSAESHFAFHDQRNRWCRASLQLVFTSFGPFGRGLNLMQRLLFLQSYWIVSPVLPFVFYMTPSIIWISGWDIFGHAASRDILYMPLLMLLINFTAITWLSRLNWVPVLSSAIQLFLAVELAPTAITSIVKPFGNPLIKILPVTPKGKSAASQSVDLRTFIVLSSLAVFTLGSFMYGVSIDLKPFRNPSAMIAMSSWTVYSLLVIAVASLMCFEPRERAAEVQFKVKQVVRLWSQSGLDARATVVALSLESALIHLDRGEALELGTAVMFDLPTIGTIPATVKRRGPKNEWELMFGPLQMSTRHSLIVALFTDWKIHYVEPQRKAAPIFMGIMLRYLGVGK